MKHVCNEVLRDRSRYQGRALHRGSAELDGWGRHMEASGLAPSGLEVQILELEAQKSAAFDRDDLEECTRLRERQMALLEEAEPGSRDTIEGVASEELSGKLQEEVASVMKDVEELSALRAELQADLAVTRQATADAGAAVGGGSGQGDTAVDARADTMRAVAELEELKRQLMGGRSLQECGIEDDDEIGGVGGWAASPSATQQSRMKPGEKDVQEVAFAAASATDTKAMMAEMAQLNAEMDAELASLSAAVGAAKAQRNELSGMHGVLLQQFEETRQEIYRTEDSVEAKAF
jgi:hypothetical protein